MLTRTQTLVIVFVVAAIAAAFFGLVLDLPAFVSGALAGLAAIAVVTVVRRQRGAPPR